MRRSFVSVTPEALELSERIGYEVGMETSLHDLAVFESPISNIAVRSRPSSGHSSSRGAARRSRTSVSRSPTARAS